ncbi:MAG: iron donor protein CyaY [Candidatus Binatus sp.]|uniref:iron donor protein CyaY n=1 Tax=Candidatus Binatus sp. TaxID=2811406 RepID=UPI00271BF606|nr:iron donor protein CyaY [Candidatus Binatus sp.]MDO8433043.1 iron donor protein CyaY [Candidatus Binatus sp.]
MDDAEFLKLSDACLAKVAKWLEDLDPDEVDFSAAEGVVNIEFADGAKFVLSRQSQMKQMWLAAGAHGFHYKWDASRATWLDDKDAHELYPRLAEAISEQIAHPVTF